MGLSLGEWANPLQAAAKTGQLQIVQQLVEQGSAIDKPGHKNITALHLACLEGHDMVVQYLIEVGANVMARDDDLETPLHFVLRGLGRSSWRGPSPNGFLRTVQWLLVSGADIHAVNQEEQTPLMIAENIKGTYVGCLFKKGSVVAVYKPGVLGSQSGRKSISLQRLWNDYVDKRTEAAIEALSTKKLHAKAAARDKSSKQNPKRQQKQEVKRRQAAKQQQVEEKTRIEKENAEEKVKAPRDHKVDQCEKKGSSKQAQESLRQAWVDLSAKDETESQPVNSTESCTSVNCKHAELTWKRRKDYVDCEICHGIFTKRFFFPVPGLRNKRLSILCRGQ
jgi:hypothetical protein